MTDARTGSPRRRLGLLVVGIVLTVIGVIAMFFFGFGTPGKDTALNNAVWESSLTIGSAVLTGVGILLIAIAILRWRRPTTSREGRLQSEAGVAPPDER